MFDRRRKNSDENFGSLYSENDNELFRAITNSQEDSQAVIQMLTGNPTAEQCLDQAIILYKKAEEEDNKICSFNIGKCLFEKVVCIMDDYGSKEFFPLSKKAYYESRKDEILDLMKQIKDKVKHVQKISQQMAKPAQIN